MRRSATVNTATRVGTAACWCLALRASRPTLARSRGCAAGWRLEEACAWRSDGSSYGDGKTRRPARSVAPDERLSWGADRRAGRPARGGDVRRHVRLPAHHGAEPAAGDHDERHRDDLLPADRQGKVPSYLGTSASFVGGVAAIRAQGGDSGRRHRRDPGRRRGARDRRRAHPLPRRRACSTRCCRRWSPARWSC